MQSWMTSPELELRSGMSADVIEEDIHDTFFVLDT
jgi:hypothetical protein